MKQLMSGGRKILAWLFVCIMLISCVISGIPAEAVARNKVTDVSVIKPAISELTLKQGAGYVLKAEASPKTAKSKALRYRSSRQEVVAVSAKGKLKAKKCGKAVLTVLSADGKKKARVKVTVVKSLKKAKKVTLKTKKLTLYVGGTKKEAQAILKAQVLPKNATVKKVVYKAAGKDIISVNKNGVVTAKKEGKTEVIVYAGDGWGKKLFVMS